MQMIVLVFVVIVALRVQLRPIKVPFKCYIMLFFWKINTPHSVPLIMDSTPS